ncbi:MAG: ABC transporter ATP-binding protein/permease [Acidobacteriia bacterium]|nr:ABC transporter ATP-binding protein/permease [Terriglobia bacterium]
MNDFRRLLPFIRPYRLNLGISFVLLFAAGIFEVLTTALAIPLLDELLGTQTVQLNGDLQKKLELLKRGLALLPGSLLEEVAVALLVFTLVKGLCLYFSNYLMSYAGQGVVTDLRNQLYRHVLSQSMGFFSRSSTGLLMSRMNSDVEQVQEAVSTSVADLFRESVLLISLTVWIFFIDWRLAGLSLAIAPLALGLTMAMGKRIRQASLHSRENVASLSDLLQQSLTGMRILKAFGMEEHEQNRFQKVAAKLFSANMRAASIQFVNSPVMEMLAVVCIVPLLIYANARIHAHTLTPGLFGGSIYSLFRMYDPIRKLSRLHVNFQRAFASASRINELFDTHVEIHDRPGARALEGVDDSVRFENVCFDYQGPRGQKPVLKNINLRVQRNRVVALVGSSGSGKSTLVSLIPRFYDVSSGAVLIDGVDVRDYTQSSLRRNIAIVTQDTFLFNDTIHNNIAYGDIRASEERIVAAARAALAHDFIMQMPKKYETRIGERGQRLSGGERQRISIARAILRNAPILILDEATSALDSESEQLVQQALGNLMQDRTTFVIAHRLSTIRNADMIVVIDKGRILEIGTHDSLLECNGLYYRYFRLQTDEAFAQGQA